MPTAQLLEHLGQGFYPFQGIDTQQLIGCSGRIGQGTKHIEDRPDPHLLTWTNGMFHGAMM